MELIELIYVKRNGEEEEVLALKKTRKMEMLNREMENPKRLKLISVFL